MQPVRSCRYRVPRLASCMPGACMGEPWLVADTSFLYELFSNSDVYHSKARRAAVSADAILVPSEIYSETVSLIHCSVGFAAAKSAGGWMRAQKRMEVAPSHRPVFNGC